MCCSGRGTERVVVRRGFSAVEDDVERHSRVPRKGSTGKGDRASRGCVAPGTTDDGVSARPDRWRHRQAGRADDLSLRKRRCAGAKPESGTTGEYAVHLSGTDLPTVREESVDHGDRVARLLDCQIVLDYRSRDGVHGRPSRDRRWTCRRLARVAAPREAARSQARPRTQATTLGCATADALSHARKPPVHDLPIVPVTS